MVDKVDFNGCKRAFFGFTLTVHSMPWCTTGKLNCHWFFFKHYFAIITKCPSRNDKTYGEKHPHLATFSQRTYLRSRSITDFPTVVFNFKASRSHSQLSNITRRNSLLGPELLLGTAKSCSTHVVVDSPAMHIFTDFMPYFASLKERGDAQSRQVRACGSGAVAVYLSIHVNSRAHSRCIFSQPWHPEVFV